MSNNLSKTQKYERIPSAGSPRLTEGWALIEAAKRMSFSITVGNCSDAKFKEQRKSTVKLNWKLWTIFQAELTLEQPEMDEEIRLNMLTLCKFVDKHTIGTLIEPTDDNIAVLIDLNRNIALGLLNMPEEEVEKESAERATKLFSKTDLASAGADQPQPQKVEISV